jgi:N-acetylneuraminate synthase
MSNKTYIIAEIGLNHNGDLDIAHKLMIEAAKAGVNAVKFQKRTPELAVPKHQWDVPRNTPWGPMSYIDYKKRIEFDRKAYIQIDLWAKSLNIDWSASVWDKDSLRFLQNFDVPWIKIPSAKITDLKLLSAAKDTGKPVIISTGMSEIWEIEQAIAIAHPSVVMHCNSQYPAPVDQLNLLAMETLAFMRGELGVDYDIGYSGHETGLATTVAAVALGATYIERHITLDRSMWGTDQSASVEPTGFRRLVRDIRSVESAMGDGIIKVEAGEKPIREKLRG